MPAAFHDTRMQMFTEAGLYLVTSQELSAGRQTLEVVRAAVGAGVRLVQLREKSMPVGELRSLAMQVRAVTGAAGALLIINDHLDLALECGADGVHLGQDDLSVAAARRRAPELVIGASSHNMDEALKAQADGASYVNIGPVYATQTKQHLGGAVGLEMVREVGSALAVPFTVMGGIKLVHVAELLSAGARTLAVVTAVTAAEDPGKAAAEMLSAIWNDA